MKEQTQMEITHIDYMCTHTHVLIQFLESILVMNDI